MKILIITFHALDIFTNLDYIRNTRRPGIEMTELKVAATQPISLGSKSP